MTLTLSLSKGDDCTNMEVDEEMTVTTDKDIVSEWNGFHIIGDNLDKNIKPRFLRVDHHSQSLHFFHLFALKDLINLSGFSNEPNQYFGVQTEELPFENLLPSTTDYQSLISNFGVLVARVLVAHIPYFKTTFDDVIVNHIQHEHRIEMSKKSQTVNDK